jgi:hypothetical protein
VGDPQAEHRAAARRARITLRRTSLHARDDGSDVVRGEEALALVTRLTREGWLLAGLPCPDYERSDIPVRFVPRASA